MSSRYERQTKLSAIGISGQEKLNSARIAIIGCGGLGSIVAPYLAGAGIGHLVLMDGDRVDLSNLHRQVFFSESDIGKNKATVLANRIKQLNSEINVATVTEHLTKATIATHLKDIDVVIECTDDIYCKYLVNDFCHLHNRPLVYGAIHKTVGYVSLFQNRHENDIHLRDVFATIDDTVPTCSEVGVMNTIAGIIGLLQANEALKYVLNKPNLLSGKWLTYNALTSEQFMITLRKTYSQDLAKMYERESYSSASYCQDIEITLEEAIRNNYPLYSILPDEEHKDIGPDTMRLDPTEFESLPENAVIYCFSGKRSGQYARTYQRHFPERRIYSLRGGYKSL